MRISGIETFVVGNPWKNWTFLKLLTDEGLIGWGEATHHRQAKTAETNLIEMQRYYRGFDPFDVESIWRSLDQASAAPQTKAAVNMACWDIVGKALGQPVYRLIGGKVRDRIRAYANGWYQVDRRPEEFARVALQVVAKGYTALKFDPFGSAVGPLSNAELDLSLAIIAAVRDAVGPDVEIFIEAHGRFDPATAVKVGRLLEPFNPGWFEEPVRSWRIDELASIAERLTIPISAGEGLHRKEEFQALLAAQAANVIQPDPITASGITEVKKIAAVAEAHNVLLAPHNAQGPICTAACLHIDASTPNVLIQEMFEDFATPLASLIVDHPAVVEDGHIFVSDRPGLGVNLKEEVMVEYPYDESHFLDLYGGGGWEKRNLR